VEKFKCWISSSEFYFEYKTEFTTKDMDFDDKQWAALSKVEQSYEANNYVRGLVMKHVDWGISRI